MSIQLSLADTLGQIVNTTRHTWPDSELFQAHMAKQLACPDSLDLLLTNSNRTFDQKNTHEHTVITWPKCDHFLAKQLPFSGKFARSMKKYNNINTLKL